jgi:hypothetical protein
MLIGSNNSLTYLKPFGFFDKLKQRLVKCQEIPYDEQYTFWSVRYFDFRLYVNNHRHIIIKNCSDEYTIFSFYEALDYFEKKSDVVVNFTLDASLDDYMSSNYAGIENKFLEVCNIVNTIYHNIEFRGGTRKFDGKVIYEFKKRDLPYKLTDVNPSSWSKAYRFVTRWCPYFIRWFNRMYINRYKDKHVFLVLNYVNRR